MSVLFFSLLVSLFHHYIDFITIFCLLAPIWMPFCFPRLKDESSSSDEDHRSSSQVSGSCQSESLLSPSSICYKKTLRLTSDQLVQCLFLQVVLLNSVFYVPDEMCNMSEQKWIYWPHLSFLGLQISKRCIEELHF